MRSGWIAWGSGTAALFAAATGYAQAPERPLAPLEVGQAIAGELTPNDTQRRSGKYEDGFLLTGRRGERIELRLGSSEFDAYLLVTGPEAYAVSNDDEGEGQSTDSRLILELPADGTYRVAATSFRPGATGSYRLEARRAAAGVNATRPEQGTSIAIGGSAAGRLESGDDRLGSGEHVDRYLFNARRGQRVRVDLRSPEFDTYLILRRPDGSQDDADDMVEDGRSRTDSRIDTVLAEDGQYTLLVTSFRPGEEGKYQLSLQPSPGHPRQRGVAGGPKVLALLVGVSEYGGRTTDLPNTDRDARDLRDSLSRAGLLHPASILLTNKEATAARLQDAFARLARAAGPDDLFLFFFSGHGDQVDVGVGRGELDGRAETIELRDRALTDAELGSMFATVGGRMALVAIDSCYSGGFRNLVSRPNVMGLFSSEEDLTSLVADRFKAGGFLSYFLRTGLAGEADDDGDRIITAGELATHVRRRFRREGDIPATTREDERHFQNLVIERGGVHIEDAVVRLAASAEERAERLPVLPVTTRAARKQAAAGESPKFTAR